MDAVGAEHQRRLDVVVDDKRHAVARAQAPRRAAALDRVELRNVFQPPLDHGCTAVDRAPRGFEIGHDRMQPHVIRARPSSVAGSSAASAS